MAKNKKEMVKKESKEVRQIGGWKPMPVSLKVLFIIMIIGSVSSLFSLNSVYITGYAFLGINVFGLFAILITALLNIVGSIILIIGLWSGKKWGYYYGIGYFAFFTLNALLSIIGLRARIDNAVEQLKQVGNIVNLSQMMYSIAIVSLIIGIGINVLFFYLIYRKSNYFK